MRWDRHETVKRLVVLVTVLMFIFLLGCTSGAGKADLIAENSVFNKSTLRVRAGTEVSITFENRDNVPHNFAVYTTAEARQVVYQGEAFSSPGTVTYTFTAPEEPGSYYFQCDFHPATMNGRFVVSGTAS